MGFITDTARDDDLGELYGRLDELKRLLQAGELSEEEYRRQAVELQGKIALASLAELP